MANEQHAAPNLERDALYYPYIHIRNVDWLKRALLIFPHVARIIPRDFYPADDRRIWEFENTYGRWNRPLLRAANLGTYGVQQAQFALLNMLREDCEQDPDFQRRFGQEAALQLLRAGQSEFNLHEDKPIYELTWFLRDRGLIWPSHERHSSADTAVHPAIGEAIMSTIAMACAQDEGFDVVTDEGRVHRHLNQSDVRDLYRSLIRGETQEQKKYKANEAKLCELVVFQQCDVSKLTADRLAELSKEHEAIDALRGEFASIAARIPEMQNGDVFEDRLKGAVNDALEKWKRDKMNLSNVTKEIFGPELLKPAEGLLKNLIEKFAVPAIGGIGTAGASASVGVAAGAALSGTLIGVGGGFVVALLLHGATSWNKAAERARKSPYRYLTKIEEAGVSFTVAS